MSEYKNVYTDVNFDEIENKSKKALKINPLQIIAPILTVIFIVASLLIYANIQRAQVVKNTEAIANSMNEYIAQNISNEIGFAESSIKLASLSLAQSMTDFELTNPKKVIAPFIDDTPFDDIEFIRPDGMNIMNIGSPFDASDRVYYKEGIKGNTGIWCNFHPKTSKETLVNFYTPLMYQDKIAGVLTGYIKANNQLASLFSTTLFDEPIAGVLVDENNMIICSTYDDDYIADYTVDMFLDKFDADNNQKEQVKDLIKNASFSSTAHKDPVNEGRMFLVKIPDTNWTALTIVPASSFSAIIAQSTTAMIVTISVVVFILFLYAAYVLLRNVKRRIETTKENEKLLLQNRVINEENRKAFDEISMIRDIIASAKMGTWRIEMIENKEPKMFVDDTMKEILGIKEKIVTPEEMYQRWFNNIAKEALISVLASVKKMQDGSFDENTYLWNHPTLGKRYVRCGGSAIKLSDGFLLRGYHYDADETVKKELYATNKLKDALNEKSEFNNIIETIANTYYSLHVVDLVNNTTKEFNAANDIQQSFGETKNAIQMMVNAMSHLIADDYKKIALEFTDLTTVSSRMKNKVKMSKQLLGINTGWIVASFIALEKDIAGNVTKVIFTTSDIDEEKRYEQNLINKSQTDELTSLLNRRAYEETIIECENELTPDFVYISLDVNGLKQVNDNLGHVAGDELIRGAAKCMKESFADLGKIFRIGGDEFAAILHCDLEKLKMVLSHFENITESYKGDLINEISISYGVCTKKENPDFNIKLIANAAEKLMYTNKAAHYRKKGFDRRGQAAAHTALCNLYTKILKINITEDSYAVINMNQSEQTLEKGFDPKISVWLQNFGKKGQVHQDDLAHYLEKTDLNYLKDYFKQDKTSLCFFYRRKSDDQKYQQVMMELIPADDYDDNNQTLFLYVKSIDK